MSRRDEEALKRDEAENGINFDQLESMSHNKADFFLKIKYSSMSTTCCQKIGSKQNYTEKECFSTSKTFRRRIKELRLQIMFRKVIEVLPMFKSVIYSSTFLKDAQKGFILVQSNI